MLLCEFILNSTRAPPGEEFLYHTLLELHLMGDGEEEQSTQQAGGPGADSAADSAAHGSSESSQQTAQASTSQVAYKWTAEDAVTGCNRMTLHGVDRVTGCNRMVLHGLYGVTGSCYTV